MRSTTINTVLRQLGSHDRCKYWKAMNFSAWNKLKFSLKQGKKNIRNLNGSTKLTIMLNASLRLMQTDGQCTKRKCKGRKKNSFSHTRFIDSSVRKQNAKKKKYRPTATVTVVDRIVCYKIQRHCVRQTHIVHVEYIQFSLHCYEFHKIVCDRNAFNSLTHRLVSVGFYVSYFEYA